MLIHWYRLSHWLWRHHVPLLPKLIWRLQYLLFNSSAPASDIRGIRSFSGQVDSLKDERFC